MLVKTINSAVENKRHPFSSIVNRANNINNTPFIAGLNYRILDIETSISTGRIISETISHTQVSIYHRMRTFTLSIQPAKAYEDESVMIVFHMAQGPAVYLCSCVGHCQTGPPLNAL